MMTTNDADQSVRESRGDIAAVLRRAGVSPTSQRLAVAEALLAEPVHLSAEEVAAIVEQNGHSVSRATIYNTLRRFVEKGLLRQVYVGADRIVYDSNTAPHHHFFDAETGRLTDVEIDDVNIQGLPELPEGRELDGIELILRLKAKN